MSDKDASHRRKLNLRQTIEGMPLFFNPSAAGDLKATMQFDVNGKEPGTYHLKIDSGCCTFHRGACANPTLTIKTPSEVWLRISTKEISGQDALFQGLYTAEGDTRLLLKFDSIFAVPDNFSVRDDSEPSKQLFQILRHRDKSNQAAPAFPGQSQPESQVPTTSYSALFGATWS